MPVYNYICNNCGAVFSLIVKKNGRRMKPECKRCGSRNIIKAKERMHVRRICHNFI